MQRQIVLTIEIDLTNIRSVLQFFQKMQSEFRLPEFFWFSFDSLNDCMRDLSWFDENYLIIHFFNLNRIKNPKLRTDIQQSIECWHNYWQSYQENKIVIISIT